VRNAVKSESNLLHVLLAEVERAGILLGRGNSVAGGAMFGTASMLAAEY
jgi:hypothetical protein